jgi:hypothetical protein
VKLLVEGFIWDQRKGKAEGMGQSDERTETLVLPHDLL